MRRAEANRLARARLRKLGPIPQGDPHGFTIHEPNCPSTAFITFAEIEDLCSAIMDPRNEAFVENELGKPHYSRDPTYNLRKR